MRLASRTGTLTVFSLLSSRWWHVSLLLPSGSSASWLTLDDSSLAPSRREGQHIEPKIHEQVSPPPS
jgi:hypothetical protein